MIDKELCVKHLSDVIKFKTISYADKNKFDYEEFGKLHQYLFEAFPLVYKNSSVEVVNKGSLIFHIKGSDDSLLPCVFMAHLDVVSIVEGTESDWTYPPFSGYVDENYIWGRGSIDTKCMVVGELEALENLLSMGFIPKRDIYLCYGHDEETAGGEGQLAIANLLKERGLKFEFVIDEGGTYEPAAKFGAPETMICPIGVFEKGYADVVLKTKSKGGHSSNPGMGSSLGLLCKAIANIENHQFDKYLPKALETTFIKLKDDITVEPLKTYIEDINKYHDELIDYCYNDYFLNPFVHTTIATTMLKGGSQGANVLPQNCEALINLRTSELDSLDNVIKHFRKYTECEVYLSNGLEPSKTSRTNSYVLDKIEELSNKLICKCKVVPILLCGGTDCRFYDDLSDMCYRFSPYLYPLEHKNGVHGTNEHMPIDGYFNGICLFMELMKELC